jgi:hypothetical protein
MDIVVILNYINTVKPAHVTTSIKQSPVLKGHFFMVTNVHLFQKQKILQYLFQMELKV